MIFWKIKSVLYTQFREKSIFGRFLDEENRAMLELLTHIKLDSYRIADVGCGTGNVARTLKSRFPKERFTLMCIDQSPDMLLRIAPSDSVSTCVADALNMPFDTGSFDLIFCVGMSDYIKDHAALLLELQRICRFDGELFITFARTGFWNFLRNIYGKWIYCTHWTVIEQVTCSLGLETIGKSETRLQYQMLLKNKKNEQIDETF